MQNVSWHEGRVNRLKHQCIKVYKYFNSLKRTWKAHLLNIARNVHTPKDGFVFINTYLPKDFNVHFPEGLNIIWGKF